MTFSAETKELIAASQGQDLTLQKMAEIAEKAGDQIRELDFAIFKAIGGIPWEEAYRRAQEPCGAPPDVAEREAVYSAPQYTGFIDAALLLVPDGVEWAIYRNKDGTFTGECEYYAVSGKTAPTALVAAALIYRSEEMAPST